MTLEQIGMAVMILFIVTGIVATVVDGERKPKRKSNIRLPRTTAWDRARGYYGDTH